MSFLTSILSNIDPSAATQPSAPNATQTQPPKAPTPGQGQAGGVNRAILAQPTKRKAEGQPDYGQAKLQRRDAPIPPNRMDGSARPNPALNVSKPKLAPPPNSIPYRGTAASASTTNPKPIGTALKSLSSTAAKATPGVPNAPNTISKSTPKTAIKAAPGTTPSTSTAPSAAAPRPGSYAAMMAKAKQAQETKAATPPVKHEPMKILSKKERMALRAEAKAAARLGPGKTKSLGAGGHSKTGRPAPGKGGELDKDKRKPADIGWKGTMRPKQSVEPEYKGTAKSGLARKPTNSLDRSRSTSLNAKSKSKDRSGRYGGYASWSDVGEEDEEDEEDYASDASSDMEGGMWDVEQEEKMALAAAKREDAEALREENELKRQKEERKRKLSAMNAAAAAKRKY